MAKLHLYLDQRKPSKDGRCPVRVSVFWMEDGKKKRVLIPTGVLVLPKNWDAAKEADKRNGANNALLSAYLDRAKETIAETIKSGSRLNSDALKAALAGDDGAPDDESRQKVLPYFRSHAAGKRGTRTVEIYEYTARKVEEFAGPDLTWKDITHKWLTDWDRWMERTMPSANSRGIHLRNLRHVVNAAIDDGLLTTYPFRRFSIKKTETEKLALSVQQLREVIRAELPSGWHYRDMFVLSFLLQGINIGDLCSLTVGCYDGERLRYRRSKTGKLYSIKVEPEAAAIIERYRGQQGTYLLDILEHWGTAASYRSKYNKRMKQLFPGMPHMSSNVARHTYATLLGEIDVPIEVISQALGHSIGSSVTAIYVKHDQRKVDDANRRLFDWVFENKEGSR